MPIQYEGTWEEVARHADDLRGKRIRVVVLEEAPAANEIDWDARHAAFKQLMGEIDQMVFEPPLPGLRADADSFGDELLDKYRKQGLDL